MGCEHVWRDPITPDSLGAWTPTALEGVLAAEEGPRCSVAGCPLPAPALSSPHCAPGLQRGRGIVLGQAQICPACKLPSSEVGWALLGAQEPPGLDLRRLCGRGAKRGVES